jgi:hypothetical protein
MVANVGNPTNIFKFKTQTILKCVTCGGLKFTEQEQPLIRLELILPPGKIDENTIVDFNKCIE